MEPIVAVLGPRCGGTSAVAGVLHHLGVFMGAQCHWTYRQPHETWEEYRLSRLCGHAFRPPDDRLQMDPRRFEAKLRDWAGEHRRAASAAGAKPGAKDPMLCVAVDAIRAAWGPMTPVVVDRPAEKIVASLTRCGWLADEPQRVQTTAHLIAERDAALSGVATIRVDFEQLRATPAAVIGRLADDLGLQVTDARLRAAVDSVTQPAPSSADRYGIDLLLAKAQAAQDDWWAVNQLANAYFDSGDFASAQSWYARQVELGGPANETWYALWQIAESMARLNAPWPDIQDAYLRAWEFRPTRAEPLYAIAQKHRVEKRYHLGHLFAERAAAIPLPEDDLVFGRLDSSRIYAWQAADEQTLCGLRIGKHAEGFALCRRMLARPDLPDEDRKRIANNRDVSVPAMLAAAASYPAEVIRDLGGGDAEVTVSLIAGPDPAATEATLNSFLHCCLDVARVGRFLVTGCSAADRAVLAERYPFLQFTEAEPTRIREQVAGRFWLQLGSGWRFFAPEHYISRLTAVLDTEPQVFQVGINLGDAATLTGVSAAEQIVRRGPAAGRYVIGDAVSRGPAMVDTTRLDRTESSRAATLDEVLCIATI